MRQWSGGRREIKWRAFEYSKWGKTGTLYFSTPLNRTLLPWSRLVQQQGNGPPLLLS
jgi:hypothetical protein